jgi:hypothetical protein
MRHFRCNWLASFHGPFGRPLRTKKADVAGHPKVFDHVGLLVNEPPGTTGLPSI